MKRLVTLGVAALALLIPPSSPASAAERHLFFVNCPPSQVLADDPIVHRGVAGASHEHQFFGNLSTNAFSTYESMIAAPTTCVFPPDTAGYWVPTAYDDGIRVVPRQINAYYRPTTSTRSPDQAFPADFRMVAGGSIRAAYWTCGASTTRSITIRDCGSKLVRANVVFPACWNGIKDPANDTANVTYSISRGCPSTHPIALPRLTVVVVYPFTNGTGVTLASGPPETLHGDFWNTWQQTVLEGKVQECLQVGVSPTCGKLA